ncbi:MAG TPA: glycosyltransferase family 2 protein, partial [Rhodanobacteraceae bacterium]|nr:glycosyltransferase family 2 protein [Rhodanobacteraceae bacterium]
MISFIVPAYNEALLLGATLDALHVAARAAEEDYEIVVVDDASTDDTALVATRHGARLISVAHRQIAATRNSGARAAQGELLIFVDADTSVNETVIRGAIDALRDGAVGGGAAVAFEGAVPLYGRLL